MSKNRTRRSFVFSSFIPQSFLIDQSIDLVGILNWYVSTQRDGVRFFFSQFATRIVDDETSKNVSCKIGLKEQQE